MDKYISVTTLLITSLIVTACDNANKNCQKYFDQDLYEEALIACQSESDSGDADAKNILALMYGKGIGVEQNYTKAKKLLESAVLQGHAYAQNNLGMMYEKGLGVEQDYQKAKMLYELAVSQGDAEA